HVVGWVMLMACVGGVFFCNATLCRAQDKASGLKERITSSPRAPQAEPTPLPIETTSEDRVDSSARKKFRIRGPLVSLFKPKTIKEAPRRLLHWFKPQTGRDELSPEINPYAGLSPRSWTSTVGWHPTASAFND